MREGLAERGGFESQALRFPNYWPHRDEENLIVLCKTCHGKVERTRVPTVVSSMHPEHEF
jgi:hypothetical protein